jgi:predicted RNA-binding protein
MAKAYLDAGDERELLLEDVALVERTENKLRISNLFGESTEVEAVIREVDFQNGSIVLERPS